MISFLIGAGIEMIRFLVISVIVLAPFMTYRRTRNVIFAVIKFVNRKSPWWAKPAMFVCGLIPGQADEIILAAFLLIPIMRNSYTRRVLGRTIAYAWNI